MQEVVSKLDNESILALSGMLVGVIAIIAVSISITAVLSKLVAANHQRKSQLDEMEATLKMEMIQRGMPAAEIQQVLSARMDSNKPGGCAVLGSMAAPWRMPNVFSKQA